MINHILLDNDGVLVDTEILAYRAMHDIFSSRGFDLKLETYIQNCVKTSCGVWHLLKDVGVKEDEFLILRTQRDDILTQYLSTEPLTLPFVSESLPELGRHFKLHVVTSSHRDHFYTMHKRTNFLGYFVTVTTEEDFQKRKPDPDSYLTAMRKIGAEPDECIAFEDSERGLKAAVAAGVRCIAIPNELTKCLDFSAAWQVADNFKMATELAINHKFDN